MPGLRRKDSGTEHWTAIDWRRACMWNVVFLIGWTVFFTFAVVDLLHPLNWLMLVPTLVIALVGGAAQIGWLLRVVGRTQSRKDRT